MILENITFDVPTSLVLKKVDFFTTYSSAFQSLFSKQWKQEDMYGYSDKYLIVIKYWAMFALCVVIKDKISTSGDSSFTTYNNLYDLTTIAKSLQLEGIDITKTYHVFNLFGY
jgi:hypothetical protein